MKAHDMLDAVGGIDPKFVEKAQEEKGCWEKRQEEKRKYALAAMAVCLCLAIAGGAVLHGLNSRLSDAAQDADSAAVVQPDASEGGVYLPPLTLPEPSDDDMEIAADMIGLVVYKGGIYTQSEDYRGADADRIDDLVGDYIGFATGSIDEWSTQDDYSKELASTCSGDVYTVDGYDPGFRICLRREVEGEGGQQELWIQFLDRLNGITLHTGSDLFEDRLHIGGRVVRIRWQAHEDWNWAKGNIRDAELEPSVWDAFINAIDSAEFFDAWDPKATFYEDKPDSSIYDTDEQAHLFLAMDDGTEVQLRLINGGYVQYDTSGGANWLFVRIPDDIFEAVYNSCTE